MRVPLNWLREFIAVDNLSAPEIAEKLTRAGVEVEGTSCLTPPLPGVVVAEVLSYAKHPAADKLWVARVSTGSEEFQVVAGVQNYAVGDKVPLALPGAKLPGGDIKRTEIRGVTSNGMLCSEEELGLELVQELPPGEGILILDPDAVPGESITRALELDEEILELGLTPNRADCLGLMGVAVEVGVLTGLKAEPQKAYPPREEIHEASRRVKVEIEDPDLCLRYTAMVVDDVRVAPSPVKLQLRLLKAGIRPINNVVDISNYVMWETGQPLHAFDFDRVEGRQIIVRRARPGERIKTLDKQERILTPDMLVIADRENPVALAGVMGGYDSEITNDTRTVLVEAACFHPINNRRTARSLGLTSEASTRFEKGADPAGTDYAARRTSYLLEKMAGGTVVPGQVDVYPAPVPQKTVKLNPQKVRDLVGLDLPTEKMADIFTRLGFAVGEEGEKLSVRIPTRRRDIQGEVDLVEEVARIYGYEHIETTFPVGVMTQGDKPTEHKNLDKIREILLGAGLSEAITFSFMKEKTFNALRLPAKHPLRRAIPVKNPLSEEYGLLRTTLMGNLLNTVKYNLNRQQESLYIFEVGKVFIPKELPLKEQPQEKVTLGAAITGKRGEGHWQDHPGAADFYWLKGVMEGLFASLNLRGFTWKPAREVPYLHPTRGAEIRQGDTLVGVMGAVHPGVLDNFEISQEVYCAELDLSTLIGHKEPLVYKDLPRYPAIVRDLALIVPEGLPAAAVEEVIKKTGGQLVEKVLLFDVYTGEQVAQGHKSLAYTIAYRDYRETLRDERVNQVQADILQNLAELGVTLRS